MRNLISLVFLFAFFPLFSQNESDDVLHMNDHPSYPFDLKRVQLSDSLEIAYMETGSGEQTLLFIHGLGSYAPAWNKNLGKLGERFRCIAIDLPNYGQSTGGRYDFSMSFFARAVADFIDRLGLERVVLVGHSMGGQVAVTALLNHDLPVEKLVLLAPAGFETFTEKEKAWFSQVFTPAVVRATPTDQLKRNFDINFAANDLPEDARFMLEDRLDMRADSARYELYCQMIPMCVQGMLEEPVFDRLNNIRVPTLIIYGQNDYLIPNRILHPNLSVQAVAESGHLQIPDSRLLLIPSCGHFVQWDCAPQVNEALEDFVSEK